MTRRPNEIRVLATHAELVMADGRISLISMEDIERVRQHRWHVNPRGYASNGSAADGRVGRLQRFITNAPAGTVVDHINRDPLDNRRENLRITTQVVNSHNRKLPSNNTTGHRGISKPKAGRRYLVSVNYAGTTYRLGRFVNLDDAIAARQAKEHELGIDQLRVGTGARP